VIQAYEDDGLAVEIERRYDTFARLTVAGDGHTSKVELGVDWRANEPILMAVGPVLHPDDAVANKMGALYGRALARDFIDIDATLRSCRYTDETSCALPNARTPASIGASLPTPSSRPLFWTRTTSLSMASPATSSMAFVAGLRHGAAVYVANHRRSKRHAPGTSCARCPATLPQEAHPAVPVHERSR
jgi:hypothetical protein